MLLLDGSRLVPLSAVVVEVAFIITATAASIVASWAILLRTEKICSGTLKQSKAFCSTWLCMIIRIVIQFIINCCSTWAYSFYLIFFMWINFFSSITLLQTWKQFVNNIVSRYFKIFIPKAKGPARMTGLLVPIRFPSLSRNNLVLHHWFLILQSRMMSFMA